jgi:hypothetical protein
MEGWVYNVWLHLALRHPVRLRGRRLTSPMEAPRSHVKLANNETQVSYQQNLLLWHMYLPASPPPSPDKPVGDAEQ